MLEEIKDIDLIQVTEGNVVQVREVSRVLRDGTEIARTYHRVTIAPGEDYSDQPPKVQAICAAAWAA